MIDRDKPDPGRESRENREGEIQEYDEHWMRRALELAREAEKADEVPVGAVVVVNGHLVGEGWNKVISTSDPTAHAEVIAMRMAAQVLGNYRLPECELFVTIEPCTMCLGASVHARVKRLVYGAREFRAGMLDSNTLLSSADIYNHKINWRGGVLETECADIIKAFFLQRRKP